MKIEILKIGVLKIKVLKAKFGHQKMKKKNKEEDTWPLGGALEGGHAWPTRSGRGCKVAALLVVS